MAHARVPLRVPLPFRVSSDTFMSSHFTPEMVAEVLKNVGRAEGWEKCYKTICKKRPSGKRSSGKRSSDKRSSDKRSSDEWYVSSEGSQFYGLMIYENKRGERYVMFKGRREYLYANVKQSRKKPR